MTTSSFLRIFLLFVFSVSLAGCELIGNIFQAGFWVGIIVIVIVVAIVMWFFGRGRS